MFTYSIWYYVLSIDGHHPSVNPSPQIPHITTTAHSINLKRKGLVQLHSNNTMTTITTTSTITIILVITVSSALAMTWIAMKQYECTTIHSIYQSITDCMNVSITSFHYLRVKACDRAAKAFIGHLFITHCINFETCSFQESAYFYCRRTARPRDFSSFKSAESTLPYRRVEVRAPSSLNLKEYKNSLSIFNT